MLWTQQMHGLVRVGFFPLKQWEKTPKNSVLDVPHP